MSLGSFNERGSELALVVRGIDHTSTNVLADLDVSLDPQKFHDWTTAPTATLGYELVGNPQVKGTGGLYGFTVSQYSAYDSRYLLKAGLGMAAQRDAFTVKAGVNAVLGDKSAGVSAQVSISYRF